MGERTLIPGLTTPGSEATTPRRTRTRQMRLPYDTPLLIVLGALILFGVIMLLSASWHISFLFNNGDSAHIFNRQLLWIAIGLAGAFVTSLIPYTWWKKLVVLVAFATVLLLLGVLVYGYVTLGAQRSLSEGSIQPSELAKLVTLLYLSVWLSNKREDLSSWWFGIVPLGTIVGIFAGLILLQPDVSAAVTILGLGVMMFFLAGGSLQKMLVAGAIAGVIILLVVIVFPTPLARLEPFLEFLKDINAADPHLQKTLLAIVQGGWLGVGIGNSELKATYLDVPHTDNIFAVIAEETGWLGATIVIALFLALLWRCLVIARKSPDLLGQLLAGGIGIWIALEALLNIGGVAGVIPILGNALPFFSAGGSNMVVSLVAMGVVLSVSRQSNQEQEQGSKENPLHAFVSLRRRDRRRRVSRPGGSESLASE